MSRRSNLDEVTHSTTDPIPTPMPGVLGGPRLVVIGASSSEQVGQSVKLEDAEVVLGRSGSPALNLDDEGISRTHARVARAANGEYELHDLGSRNGTYLNGEKVSAPVLLRHGDRIQIGANTVIRFIGRTTLDTDNAHLRQALSNARVGVFEWDLATGNIAWSDQVESALGLPRGALPVEPAPFYPSVEPQDRVRVQTALEQSVRSRCQLEVELRLNPKLGPQRWVAFKGDVIRDHRGDAARVTGTVMDVTVRRESEEELKRQALLFESLFDAVVIFDGKGRIIDCNSSAQKLFGQAKSWAIGKRYGQLIKPAEKDVLTGVILAVLSAEDRWTGELELRRGDAPLRYCETTVVPLRDSHGNRLAFIAVHRDVTEKREIGAKLLLADRLASVGTLAAGVAHEINNPLAYVSGNLEYVQEMLEAGPLDPVKQREVAQILGEVQQGAARIAAVVGDLKTFARSEANTDARGPVDLLRVVEMSAKMAEHGIRHRARVSIEADPALPYVLGSDSRLSQVFLNLMINAGQAIPEGRHGEIKVRLGPGEGGMVSATVSDDGSGMSEETVARIFDPFFTTKPLGIGTGLGLSICHGIVTSLGGRISVESKLGQGTTFKLLLKPCDAPAARRQTMEIRPPISRARVLIVDDEPLVASSLQRLLGRKHEVSAASSAKEALERLAAGEQFDTILCDLMMPEVTGMDLYAQLRQTHPELAQKMIFMTGGAFTARAMEFLENVPNIKLAKPLRPEEVARAIEGRLL